MVGPQAWLQNKPESSPLHRRADSWYEVFVPICRVWLLQKCCCAIWPNISKSAVLPHSFKREEALSCRPVLF